MNYSSKTTVAPTYLPVSVDDVKNALNIMSTSQDAVIQGALNSAVMEAEKKSGHHFAERVVRLNFSELSEFMDLPINPVQEITSFEYYDGSTWQNVTDYEADLDASPPRLWVKTIPVVGEKLRPYRITCKTGYLAGTNPNEAENIPDDIKQAIIFYATQHVIYRGDIPERPVKAFRMMLYPYKVAQL
jgi:uncharacterized phiE125 gp8 family phage protein